MYDSSRLTEIRMNITPCELSEIEEKTEKLKNMFSRAGKCTKNSEHKNLSDISIVWCDSSEIEGSGCASEDFFMVDGEV